MPTLAEYVPHRERKPIRTCAGCGALLCSRNEVETCFQCGGTWSDPLHASDLVDDERWVAALLTAYLG